MSPTIAFSASKSGGWVMILYASALHWAWAALVLISDRSVDATSVSGIAQVCRDFASTRWWTIDPTWLLFFVLFGSGLAAIYGGWHVPSLFGVALMLPQQFVLVISTVTAIQAVITGTYADGVIRPWDFILADQMLTILAAPMYTAAVLACHLSDDERPVTRR